MREIKFRGKTKKEKIDFILKVVNGPNNPSQQQLAMDWGDKLLKGMKLSQEEYFQVKKRFYCVTK